MNKKIIITVLAILLIVSVAFTFYDRIQQRKQFEAQGLAIYQQGAQVGYENAVVSLIEQAAKCEPVPIFAGNYSLNIVAVECFQQNNQTQ